MESKTIEILIKRSITSKATVKSLEICLNSIIKLDTASAKAFMTRLCETDIVKAAELAQKLNNRYPEFAEQVTEYIKNKIDNDDEIPKVVVGALVLENESVFKIAVPKISSNIINSIYDVCSNRDILIKMAEYSLRYMEDELFLFSENQFCERFSSYDSADDILLKKLLQTAFEVNSHATVSRLLEVVGADKLAQIYNKFWDEIEFLCISGAVSPQIWYAYIDHLLNSGTNEEELLINGLWFIQTNIENDDFCEEIVAYFYLGLLSLEAKGVHYEILYLLERNSFLDESIYFSEQYISKFNYIIEGLWNDKEKLIGFLKKSSSINPYAFENSANEKVYRIIETISFGQYEKLSELFGCGLSCDDIVYLFFNTRIYKKLPIEDLFNLSIKNNCLDELFEVMQGKVFSGEITKVLSKTVVISPKEYYVMSFHKLRDNDFLLQKNSQSNTPKGEKLRYKIVGYGEKGIVISIIKKNTKRDLKNQWEEIVSLSKKVLDNSSKSDSYLSKIKLLSEFEFEKFDEELDFSSFLKLLLEKPRKIKLVKKVFSAMQWNRIFENEYDKALHVKYLSMFSKYEDEVREIFIRLIKIGKPEDIVYLYFSTIFKIMLPLDEILILCQKEKILPLLKDVNIRCKIHYELKNGYACRLRNIKCAPVCVFEDFSVDESKNSTFFGYITDYEADGESISKIVLRPVLDYYDFEYTLNRIDGLYKYISLNLKINAYKELQIINLPSIAEYFWKDPNYYLVTMAQAVVLRSNNVDKLIEFLTLMKNNNPFAFDHINTAMAFYYFGIRGLTSKENVKNTVVNIVLNAKTVSDIFYIYINSFLKYHITVGELIDEIKTRRAGYSDNEYLFKQQKLLCLADNNSRLWSPFIAEGKYVTESKYKNCLLLCDFGIDGSITVEPVMEINAADIIVIILSCISVGYTSKNDVMKFYDFALNQIEMANGDIELCEKIGFVECKLVFCEVYNRFNTASYEDLHENTFDKHQKDPQWLSVSNALANTRVVGANYITKLKAVVDFFAETNYYKTFPMNYLLLELEEFLKVNEMAEATETKTILKARMVINSKLTHTQRTIFDKSFINLAKKYFDGEELQEILSKIKPYLTPYS